MIEDIRKENIRRLKTFINNPLFSPTEIGRLLIVVESIETLPRIEVKKITKTTWEACVIDQPGTPIAGHGKTWREALGDYVLNNPTLFGIKSTLRGVEGIRVLNKDGTPYKFKGEPSRED